ncbi:hypothetical protein [Pseudomonas sp.]|uniref:hypothetical protein n=1 Tax=Pseudomonas sp. TaxID=306 RepID=UPI0027344182|nr:hypothetical protein [Pseudomonas sp.]MDP2745971.1 hypothetical protein [Pseudomonas sp.]
MSPYSDQKNHGSLFFQGKREDKRRLHGRMAIDSSIKWFVAASVAAGIFAICVVLAIGVANALIIPLLVAATFSVIAGLVKARHQARFYHEVGPHRAMVSRSKKEILEKFCVHVRLETLTTRPLFGRTAVSTTYYLADLIGGERISEGTRAYCILFIRTSSDGGSPTHGFLWLNEALSDAFGQHHNVPRAVGKACLAVIEKKHLPVISFSGESGKRVAIAMMPQRPWLMMYVPAYDEEIMAAWVACHLSDIMQGEAFDTKNMIKKVAENLHRLPTGRLLPVDLIVRLTDYCTSDEGVHCLEGFYRWFWLTTRRPSSKLMRKLNDNAWMLTHCVSGVSAPSEVAGHDESVHEAFCHVVKSIIQRVGLSPNASDYKGAAVGYARLFGAEAAMARFPDSGRQILMDDFGI